MTRFDEDGLSRTAVGVALIACPLFALASSAVAPAFKSDERAQLDVVAQHPTRWYWFTLLLLVSTILLVPAYLGIAALVRERSPRLGAIGGALGALGAIIAVGDVMSQFFVWKMVTPGLDRAQTAELLHRVDNAAAVDLVYSVGGLAVLAGTIMLTVGLVRGRVAPTWVAVGLTLAVVANLVAFTSASAAGVAASWLILLASMGALGVKLLARGGRAPATGGLSRPYAAAPR
jgi:hypothetical protein